MLEIQRSLWPVHLKPLSDEILSSWLSRIAAGHGLSLNQFLTLCLPRPMGVGFDIDVATDSEFFKAIVGGTGIDRNDAIRTSFIPDQGTIYSGADPLHLEWIVPLTLTSARGKRAGLPFCPPCVAADHTPYYRKQWRYGFFPVCPEHGILTNHCPNCGHPYAYQGGDREQKNALRTGTPGYCRGCGQQFSVMHQEENDVVSAVVLLQQRIFAGLQDKWIEVPNRGLVHIYAYLKGLRQLAMIFQKVDGCRIAAWIEAQENTKLPWDSATLSNVFEKQSPRMRASALFLADWLIQEWPMRMVNMMDSLRLTPTRILPPVEDRPHWLSDSRIESLSRAALPVSKAEVESAQRFLSKQRQWPVSSSEARNFMQSMELPEIKPLHPSPSTAAKRVFLDAYDELAASYSWKKALTQPPRTRERRLYTDYNDLAARRTAQDIAEASEDIDGLWEVMRAKSVVAPDS